MSLRSQIRDAVDDVSPPALELERRVRTYVLAGNGRRRDLRRRSRSAWVYRFQGAATLLAAMLVVTVIAGLIVGGRIWRDLNATPSSINQSELKSLEGKPLHFPSVAPGGQCPASVEHLDQQIGMVIGDGPVYVVDGGSLDTNDWGTFGHLSLFYEPQRAGLVLMRVKDLQSGVEVAFAQYPLAPTGITAVGPVLGQVHAMNKDLLLRPEAVFRDMWNTPKQARGPQYLVLVAMPKGSSGCIGFQVDGPGFSKNFVVPPNYLNYL
jgi:hypothetical protein